ncbi:MAG: pilus assembly protein PilP, partial [Gammaproteobacteria bacterium]
TEKKTPKAIPPLPKMADPEIVIYDPKDLRNPFEEYVDKTVQAVKAKKDDDPNYTGPKPNAYRIREPLEKFNLNALKYVGYLQQEESYWALISDSTGMVHRITVGNYMGPDHGIIEEINPNFIRMMELVPSPEGGWQEKVTFLNAEQK